MSSNIGPSFLSTALVRSIAAVIPTTPSLHLYHHYHCFGCGAHGDHFDWLRNVEGLNYDVALERSYSIAKAESSNRGRFDSHDLKEAKESAYQAEVAGAPSTLLWPAASRTNPKARVCRFRGMQTRGTTWIFRTSSTSALLVYWSFCWA
jgi:hypothetical protein